MNSRPDFGGGTPGPSGGGRNARLVDGEYLFTREDFQQIAAMLHADSGIHLPDAKATLVYSRLAKRLRSLGLESFRDYCALVAGRDGTDERQSMLTALTTNLTRFYREPHHFEDLRRKLMPRLAELARHGGRVRLWSAGCSTGQEAYSMALTVLQVLPEAAELDVRILASDIDVKVLETAKAGVYDAAAIEAVPPDLKSRWFRPVRNGLGDKAWRLAEEVRSLIAFRELNLNAPAWPMKGTFQAIFCRNVAIYFEEATQERIWTRFAPLLEPEGRLYIGHSERVNTPLFTTDGLTTYRLSRTS